MQVHEWQGGDAWLSLAIYRARPIPSCFDWCQLLRTHKGLNERAGEYKGNIGAPGSRGQEPLCQFCTSRECYTGMLPGSHLTS